MQQKIRSAPAHPEKTQIFLIGTEIFGALRK
jgi:hypothetical protein